MDEAMERQSVQIEQQLRGNLDTRRALRGHEAAAGVPPAPRTTIVSHAARDGVCAGTVVRGRS